MTSNTSFEIVDEEKLIRAMKVVKLKNYTVSLTTEYKKLKLKNDELKIAEPETNYKTMTLNANYTTAEGGKYDLNAEGTPEVLGKYTIILKEHVESQKKYEKNRKTVTCSLCGGKDHNKRTCKKTPFSPSLSVALIPVPTTTVTTTTTKKRERGVKKVTKKICGDYGGRCKNDELCRRKASKSGGKCSWHTQENISESISEIIHPRISHEEMRNNIISIASNT